MKRILFVIAVFSFILVSGFSCNTHDGHSRGMWNYAVDVVQNDGVTPAPSGLTVAIQKLHLDYSNPAGYGDIYQGFTDTKGRAVINSCPIDPDEEVQVIVYAVGGAQYFYPIQWLHGNDEDIADYYTKVVLQ